MQGNNLRISFFIAAISVVIIILLMSAHNAEKNIFKYTENVLTKGMKIIVQTHSEKLSIEGINKTERRFSGNGWSKIVNLIPRQTRWYGSLGLYSPADSDSQEGRLLVDEGRQFFNSEDEVLRYLCALRKTIGQLDKLTYNNEGLIVTYDITPKYRVRSINIWQVYINGKKPTSLKGANDKAIQVTGGKIPNTATPYPAKVGYPRKICTKEEFDKSRYWQKIVNN